MENESQILGIELFFNLGDFSFKFRGIVNFGNIGFIGKGDRRFVAWIKAKTIDSPQVIFSNEEVNQPLLDFHRVLLPIHSDA